MKPGVTAFLALVSLAPWWRAWRRGQAARSRQRWRNTPVPTIWPTVSIIVPAWKERGTLTACLTALSYEQYDAQCEVIVVAGGSDGTREVACSYSQCDQRIRVLPQRPEGGKNGAMNDGARVAIGEILVFLDADTLVTTGWLRSLVAALGLDFAASTGRVLSRRRSLIARAGEMSQLLENEARGRVLLQGSAGMAVRRTIFHALGGIPEGPYADDWAMSQRLLHAGHRIAYAPTAVALSERPATLSEWWRNELRWRRMHLLSLFRVADAQLATPLSAAKALYPYVSAWAGLSLTAAFLIARTFRLDRRALTKVGWLGLTAPTVMREASGALETVAYTRQIAWLHTAAVLPLLTVLGWMASALATLTAQKAKLHFKGPRRPVAVPDAPLPVDDAMVVEVEGAQLGQGRAVIEA